MDKRRYLVRERKLWEDCAKCDIAQYRYGKDSVFGRGSVDADYLFIVDQPTPVDVTMGKGPLHPRYAASEKYLTFIEEAGIPMDKCFFASLVGCAAVSFIPATESSAEELRDRDPTHAEVEACRSRIERIIYGVDPRVILLCGERAYQELLPKSVRGPHTTLAKGLGYAFPLNVPGAFGPVTYSAYPLPSPAQVYRSGTARHDAAAVMLRQLTSIRQYIDLGYQSEAG